MTVVSMTPVTESPRSLTKMVQAVIAVLVGAIGGLTVSSPERAQTLDLAIRAFDRIKTSDLTMDGFTTFHGRLSMDEVGAVNEVFEWVSAYLAGSSPDYEAALNVLIAEDVHEASGLTMTGVRKAVDAALPGLSWRIEEVDSET